MLYKISQVTGVMMIGLTLSITAALAESKVKLSESQASTLLLPRVLFTTSTAYTGNLGGLAGADEICTTHANLAESIVPPGDYVAVLSSSITWASERIGITQGPILTSNGAPIADSAADLFKPRTIFVVTSNADSFSFDVDTLVTPPRYDETGASLSNEELEVWTGSFSNGSADTNGDPAFLCSNWTTAQADKTGRGSGYANAVNDDWLAASGGNLPCNDERRLYCIQK